MMLQGAVVASGRRLAHGAVQTAVAVVLPVALRDEGVRVDPLAGLAILGRRQLPLPTRSLLVVLLQVLRLQGLAQRELLGVADAEVLAERDAGVERSH